jgi:N-methylhydantoinase A
LTRSCDRASLARARRLRRAASTARATVSLVRGTALFRVGVDIGGTFTDLVLVGDDGTLATRKVSSTPPDYAEGIVAGLSGLLAEAGVRPSAVVEVVHGTTVATNAIVEGRGARTALITTEGFRDVLDLRRIRVPALYDLFWEKPPPLVPRRLRFEVAERIGPRGEVWRALDGRSLGCALDAVRRAEVEALAICLLHSYANPAHERRVAEAAAEALPGVYVTCSSDVLPEIREYERTSTTVVNAYVGPIVARYLRAIEARLRDIGVPAPLLVMQSNGGVMSAADAVARPAYIVESGPAAGVTAAARLGARSGAPSLLTLDMGGTTAKASIVEDGQPFRTSEYEVGGGINLSSQLVKGGGYALKLPLIDVSEIGAGGGSIVWIGEGERLQIGPRSAGADPGPACYRRGGTEPTVTDAHVVLGYLNPDALAGGGVPIDAEAARRVLAERVAARLGLEPLEAAYGVHRVAAATMVRAVKAVSTYRGRDPRSFALLAFGGSGPLCAVELARALGVRRVIVPPAAGVFSAFGLLASSVEQQLVRTLFRRASELGAEELAEAFAELAARATAGADVKRAVDLRYSGQAYELTVPVPGGPIDVAGLVEAFGREHLRVYGHRAASDPVDLINLRVVATIRPARDPPMPPPGCAPRRDRPAYFGRQHGLVTTPVVSRADLPARGPFVLEEYDCTCVVPPDATAALDAWGNVVVQA